MKCSGCGVELEQNAKFCTNCGKSIETQPIINTIPPQQPKKNHTALIIILVVLGVLFLFAIGIVFLFAIFMRVNNTRTKVIEKTRDLETEEVFNDIYPTNKDGDIINKIKDPLGHEIILKKDKSYIVLVDTSYLYDEATELEKNAKHLTEKQIDTLNATTEQKEAMKKILQHISGYIASDQYEIIEDLKKDNYSEEVIDFAMANGGIDWEEQAMIQAKIILAAGGFSKEELISLMKYRGFENEVAEKAASNQSLDYYEQAVYEACFYKYTEQLYGEKYDKSKASSSLKNRGYTDDEIEFAIKEVYDKMQ